MGAAASAQGLVAMSVEQVRLEGADLKEVRTRLETLSPPDLVRMLKLYECDCLRIQRRHLDGASLLYKLDDADLGKLGLRDNVLALVRRFRQDDADERARRAAFEAAKLQREEAAKAAWEARQHADLLAASGLAGMTVRTGRQLTPEERARKDYGRMRSKMAQRSAMSLATRQMEKRLQQMLQKPEVSVFDEAEKAEEASVNSKQEKKALKEEEKKKKKKAQQMELEASGSARGEAGGGISGQASNLGGDQNTKDDEEDDEDEEDEEEPMSMEEIAALDWVDGRREALLERRWAARERFVATVDDLQLLLSRSGESTASLLARGFLMRSLAPPAKFTRKKKKQKRKGQAQGGALPVVGEENSESAHNASTMTRFGPATAAEVRLVKKYALDGGADGDGHWSDSDEEEGEEGGGGDGSSGGGGGQKGEKQSNEGRENDGSALSSPQWAAIPELRDDLEAYTLTVRDPVQRRAERLEREKKAKKWAKKQRKMAAKAEKKRLKAQAAAERAEADAAFSRGEEMQPPLPSEGLLEDGSGGMDSTGSFEGGSSSPNLTLNGEPLLPQTLLEKQANARKGMLEEAEASKSAADAELSSRKLGGGGVGLFKASKAKASGFASVLPPAKKAAKPPAPAVAVIPTAYLSASAVQRHTRVEIEGPVPDEPGEALSESKEDEAFGSTFSSLFNSNEANSATAARGAAGGGGSTDGAQSP